MKYKHIFGPIPSRRLGISLGVDLVEHKTCNFNCVYCECGASDILSTERKEYVSAEEVMKELKDYLNNVDNLDYITFSGNGEPTLNSKIGWLIDEIRKITDTKICVITNSSLLNEESVRKELLKADVIMPSLDAISSDVFKKIDRAYSKLEITDIILGLEKLSSEFLGEIYLEIFFIEGLNDSKEELDKFIKEIKRINPSKIQLNTLDRPAPVEWVKQMSMKRLEEIKEYFSKELANVEIIKKYRLKKDIKNYNMDVQELILKTAETRPCTMEDFMNISGVGKTEISKYLDYLEKENKIVPLIENRGIFYKKVFDKE